MPRPLLVVAGAGSGKTETMAARVVWLVANGLVDPDQVLGLTFTRKAAAELSQRIAKRLRGLERAGIWTPPADDGTGAEVLGGTPTVSTYHAYAGRLVREHALRVGIEPEFRILTEAGAWQLAAEAVSRWDGPMDDVVKSEATVIQAVMALAGEMAEHVRTPGEVMDHLDAVLARLDALPDGEGRGSLTAARDAIAVLRERRTVLPIVEAFLALKRERESLDFADQMAIAARLTRSVPAVGEIERERFRAVLLDEFQDTSEAQLELLRSLFHHPGVALTAVGDPNQSIYGWRGASATTLLRFPSEFARRRRARPTCCRSRRAGATTRSSSTRPTPSPRRSRPSTCSRCDPGRAPAAGRSRWPGSRPPRRRPTTSPAGSPRTGSARAAGAPAAARPCCAGAARPSPSCSRPCADASCPSRSSASAACSSPPRSATSSPPSGSCRTRPAATSSCACSPVRSCASAPPTWPGCGPGRASCTPAPVARAARDPVDAGRRSAFDGARPAGGRRDPGDAGGRSRPSRGRRRSSADRRGSDLAADSADTATLVEALDDLPRAGWAGRDGARISDEALARLHDLGDVVRRLRRLTALPLVDLVAEAEVAIGLDIEVLSRPEHTASTARVHLDAFADVAARYATTADRPTLSGFLSWLDAARDQERGLDAGHTESDADAVQVLTVHAAKGLEWDVVAVPTLVEGVFPAHGATAVAPVADSDPTAYACSGDVKDKGWLIGLDSLPYDLRGDRAGLPHLDWRGVPDRKALSAAIDAFVLDGGRHAVAEERRLAYVA